MADGQIWEGVYHQDETMDWEGHGPLSKKKKALSKEVHRLMRFHIFR